MKSILSILMGIILLFLAAFVLRDLWAWFIVPLGEHIAYLSLVHAMGINLCIGYLKMGVKTAKPDETEVWKWLLAIIFAVLWLWGIGFIIHYFM